MEGSVSPRCANRLDWHWGRRGDEKTVEMRQTANNQAEDESDDAGARAHLI